MHEPGRKSAEGSVSGRAVAGATAPSRRHPHVTAATVDVGSPANAGDAHRRVQGAATVVGGTRQGLWSGTSPTSTPRSARGKADATAYAFRHSLTSASA